MQAHPTRGTINQVQRFHVKHPLGLVKQDYKPMMPKFERVGCSILMMKLANARLILTYDFFGYNDWKQPFYDDKVRNDATTAGIK